MTVYEFLDYSNESCADVEIYNITTGDVEVLEMGDARDKYGDYEVQSFDGFISHNTLCINISEDE